VRRCRNRKPGRKEERTIRNHFGRSSILKLHGRTFAMVLALVVLMGGMVSGTIAWLISESPTLVNTFTYGDIDISLEETDTELDEDEDPNTNDYKMVPGQAITKTR